MARYFDGCPFSGSHVRTPFSPYLLFYSLKIVRRVSGGAPLKSLGVHRGRREAPVAHITPFNDRNYALLRYSTSLFLSLWVSRLQLQCICIQSTCTMYTYQTLIYPSFFSLLAKYMISYKDIIYKLREKTVALFWLWNNDLTLLHSWPKHIQVGLKIQK